MVKLISFLLGMLFFFVPLLTAQSNNDAVSVDPFHHHVIFENDHVRVFEVLASPGATSQMHSHPPSVMISAGKARLNMDTPQGSDIIFDLNKGQIFWLEGLDHSWELLSGDLHVFGVEIKSAASNQIPAPVELGSRDAVTLDPTHHHVLFENDHVRVFEVLGAPGATSPMHTHAGVLGISLEKVRTNMSVPGSSGFVFDLHPGQVFWFDEAEHNWELSAGKLHVVGIEVKSAQ